jgi:hypothetical protein
MITNGSSLMLTKAWASSSSGARAGTATNSKHGALQAQALLL